MQYVSILLNTGVIYVYSYTYFHIYIYTYYYVFISLQLNDFDQLIFNDSPRNAVFN